MTYLSRFKSEKPPQVPSLFHNSEIPKIPEIKIPTNFIFSQGDLIPDTKKPTQKLFLGNLPPYITILDIQTLVGKYCLVGKINIHRFERSSAAFIEMLDEEASIAAKNDLNGFIYNGKIIRASFAKNSSNEQIEFQEDLFSPINSDNEEFEYPDPKSYELLEKKHLHFATHTICISNVSFDITENEIKQLIDLPDLDTYIKTIRFLRRKSQCIIKFSSLKNSIQVYTMLTTNPPLLKGQVLQIEWGKDEDLNFSDQSDPFQGNLPFPPCPVEPYVEDPVDKQIIDRVARAVARKGEQFELALKMTVLEEFRFLNDFDHLNQYYRYKVWYFTHEETNPELAYPTIERYLSILTENEKEQQNNNSLSLDNNNNNININFNNNDSTISNRDNNSNRESHSNRDSHSNRSQGDNSRKDSYSNRDIHSNRSQGDKLRKDSYSNRSSHSNRNQGDNSRKDSYSNRDRDSHSNKDRNNSKKDNNSKKHLNRSGWNSTSNRSSEPHHDLSSPQQNWGGLSPQNWGNSSPQQNSPNYSLNNQDYSPQRYPQNNNNNYYYNINQKAEQEANAKLAAIWGADPTGSDLDLVNSIPKFEKTILKKPKKVQPAPPKPPPR